MRSVPHYVGIDLGTTNSTVSVVRVLSNGFVQADTLSVRQPDESGVNLTHEKLLPSALYMDKEGHPFVGTFARRMGAIDPKRVITKAKRYIGKAQNNSWTIDKEKFRPETVASYILKTLKTQVEDYFGEEKVEGAVITVPANFNFQQVSATRLAAELAGFDKNKIHTIPEPTAALIEFLNEERQKDPSNQRLNLAQGSKKLMVFDLGGGTCDVSILEVKEEQAGHMDIQELSVSQYTELGGTDFDHMVAERLLMPQILRQLQITFEELYRRYPKEVLVNLSVSINNMAEKARTSFATRIDMAVRHHNVDYFSDPSHFDSLVHREMLTNLPAELALMLSITKGEYDQAISPLLYSHGGTKNIQFPIENALQQARLGPVALDDIDGVFLVGGMTQCYTIQNRIYEIFQRRIRPLRSVNPMYSVSSGAALFHYFLDRISLQSVETLEERAVPLNAQEFSIRPIVPQNVYVDVVQGEPVAILEKGMEAPYKRIIKDKFIVTGERDQVTAMSLDLFAADSSISMNPLPLRSVTLGFKRPVRIGSFVTLMVEFSLDRQVRVKAWLSSDESEVIDVNIGVQQVSEEEKKMHLTRLAEINQGRGE